MIIQTNGKVTEGNTATRAADVDEADDESHHLDKAPEEDTNEVNPPGPQRAT